MINRKLAKFLSLRYTILALIFIILAGGLVLLPKYDKREGISPENLLSKAISLERYISTDELAERIISQDPTLLLIDVRDEADFKKFSFTNALNIPLESILDEGSEPYLNQDAYDVILVSNDNFYADQAWILCTKLGYQNLYVLDGGLTAWYKTIINPEKPKENMASSQFELYTFRKAASMYFGVFYPEDYKNNGALIENMSSSEKAPKKIIVRQKKKKAAEGGC